jgi:hypothetical protein
MNQVVPSRFLFRWSFVAPRIDSLPHSSGRLLDLPGECVVPDLAELDGKTSFGQIKLAWNDAGIGISISVTGKTRGPNCHLAEVSTSDGLRLWFDTRNTQTVHRATRFCHHLIVLPAGGGPKKQGPIVRSAAIPRAREDATLPPTETIRSQAQVSADGYWIDLWIPAPVLLGFDPSAHPRIGFHYALHDAELGNQTLAVGDEFPYESDPSLWQTVRLVS